MKKNCQSAVHISAKQFDFIDAMRAQASARLLSDMEREMDQDRNKDPELLTQELLDRAGSKNREHDVNRVVVEQEM